MKTNEMMSVAEAEQVLGSEVPIHLIGQKWEAGKFVSRIVIREQLDEFIASEAAKKAAREAGKAERDARDAARRAQPKLRQFNSREEMI